MRNKILFVLSLAVLAGCAPDDGSAEFAKAEAAYAARDLRSAVQFYSVAAGKNATNLTARVKSALANIELGEIAAARDAVDSALRIDPSSAEVRFLDGQVAYFAKDYERAKKAFGEVASAGQLSNQLRSKALAAQAVMELSENQFDRARVSLWRAIRLDRRNAAAWYHLGYLSRDTFRFDDAAHEQFMVASRLMTDPVRAKEVTQKIIPSIWNSICARNASKPGASERDPGAAAKLVSEANGLLKRNPKSAAAKFAEAYKKDPLSYEAAWNFAKSGSESAKSDAQIARVINAFQDAVDQRPNSQKTYFAAATFALNRKRPIRAEKFLSQALAHDPENKQVLDFYVQTLRRLGKTAAAKLYATYRKEL